MFETISHLPEKSRGQLVASLNSRIADGLDLYSQVKTAHWNVKGPAFASLHPLFDVLATQVLVHNDALAERAVALGGLAKGTLRAAARASRLEDGVEAIRDVELTRALAARVSTYVVGLRESRALADEVSDTDTADLLTAVITDMEKQGWFLLASLGT